MPVTVDCVNSHLWCVLFFSSVLGWAGKIHNSQTPLQLGYRRKIRFTQVLAGVVWKVKARQGYLLGASAAAAGRNGPGGVWCVCSSVFMPFTDLQKVEWQC